jgi:phage tail-like protein
VARNGTGFGHFPFGNFPFGKADFGKDSISRNFDYREDENGVENELLAHYLLTIEDSVNRVKQQVDTIPDQIDFDRIRSDLLKYLGTTIDVVIDDSEPEEFQRSLVGNAVQFYRIKGTRQSYEIRGKISGFDVTINNLYRLADDLVTYFEDDDLFEVPPTSGNFFTVLPPGSVSGDDRLSGFSCDYCLTTAIKLNFDVVKALPPAITGEGNFFDRVAFKLKDIIPIHVRDVLFELTATFCIDASDSVVCVSGEETTFTPIAYAAHFDQIPADVIPLDHFSMAVSGIATVTP